MGYARKSGRYVRLSIIFGYSDLRGSSAVRSIGRIFPRPHSPGSFLPRASALAASALYSVWYLIFLSFTRLLLDRNAVPDEGNILFFDRLFRYFRSRARLEVKNKYFLLYAISLKTIRCDLPGAH